MHAATPIDATPRSATMRAVVHPRYGEPDVLSLEEVPRPTPGDEDVLVRVHAAGVSIGDHHVITGKPYVVRLTPFGGFPRPRNRVPGATMAGRVEAVGARVTAFRPGDEVYGQAVTGAFAESLVVPARLIAPKPTNLSFTEAAAVPWAFAALQALRDAGGLKPGQKVLINGASGGVGTWAVQIARALGAEVTAVCSTRNVDMVRTLGAHTVIDYTRDDFVAGGARFDVFLDAVGNRSLSDCRKVLLPRGTYVACAGGDSSTRWILRMAWMVLTGLFTSQKLAPFMASPNQKDLLVLKELIEAGKARPVIERCYPLTAIGDALRHVGEGHVRGQIVVQIAE